MDKIIAVSGGFDPIHEGHIDMIEAAAGYGRVHVYLNSDEWLKNKKGYIFMPYITRARILMAIKGVELVIPVIDEDHTVCETLRKFKPDYYVNGGDRLPDNTPEVEVCKELCIETLWNVGGGKVNSSSWIVSAAAGKLYDRILHG